jgi:hypothetical protein
MAALGFEPFSGAWPQGNKLRCSMVISIHQGSARGRWRNFLIRNALNVLGFEVDKNQTLAHKYSRKTEENLEGTGMGSHILALELLDSCGMIFRASLLTSSDAGPCNRPLSYGDHYSSVIFPNGLNLSGG